MITPLMVVENLKKHYVLNGGKTLKALDGVSFSVGRGETLGIVGESGCGKSTLGRTVLRLVPATEGTVTFEGKDIFALGHMELRQLRKKAQIVFQDPFSSLNPRMAVAEIIGEALDAHGGLNRMQKQTEVQRLLETVGLSSSSAQRYPHEFSGGQRQRIGIARALAVKPNFIVCDEPVSALDVSVQSHILNLLSELKSEFGLTYLFIAHDLGVVSYISDRVAVMYLGRIVEIGTTEKLYAQPLHPYTQALLASVPEPVPGTTAPTLTGELPSPFSPPNGCHFHARCPHANSFCQEVAPNLIDLSLNHSVACHYAGKSA